MTPMDDFSLRRDLRALRVDSVPAGDLWSGIEARIRATPVRRSPLNSRIAWLGGMAAAVMVALWLARVPDRPTVPNDATPAVAMGAPPAAAAIDPAETVLAAYTQILAAEQAQGAQWQRQLTLPGGPDRIAAARELDVSLANMAAALRVDPHSQLLRRLMHHTLQQRAALTLDALDA